MNEITNIDEYQEKAISLAVYPPEYKTLYPTLGLCGEAGEVAEKLIPFITDEDYVSEKMSNDIMLEIGDIMWYMATTAHDIDMTLSDCICINLGDHYDSFKDAQDKSVIEEQYPDAYDCIIPALKLFSSIGAVSELVKKYVRDDNQVMSDIRKNKIAFNIGAVYRHLSCLTFDLSIEMQHCADANLEKLFSRQKRNQIKGDGDHR